MLVQGRHGRRGRGVCGRCRCWGAGQSPEGSGGALWWPLCGEKGALVGLFERSWLMRVWNWRLSKFWSLNLALGDFGTWWPRRVTLDLDLIWVSCEGKVKDGLFKQFLGV